MGLLSFQCPKRVCLQCLWLALFSLVSRYFILNSSPGTGEDIIRFSLARRLVEALDHAEPEERHEVLHRELEAFCGKDLVRREVDGFADIKCSVRSVPVTRERTYRGSSVGYKRIFRGRKW